MTTRKAAAPSRAKKTPAKKPSTRRAPAKRQHSGPQATPATKRVSAPVAPEPSKAPKGFIVVDGSNIANSSRVKGLPRLENIQRVHDVLVHEGYEPVIFVDASLRHQISDTEKKQFAAWEDEAFIIQVPRGVNGDEAVLEFAGRRDAPVLSNDNYQDLEERYPWVRDRRRRIPYNLVRGELILYKYQDPPAPPAAPPVQPTPGPVSSVEPPRYTGRGRQPAPGPGGRPAFVQAPVQPASPAPTPVNALPATPTSNPSQPAAPQQKHRNFRQPRQPPRQQLVPTSRPEPVMQQDAESIASPVQAPPRQQRGRGQNIPRATEVEWNALRDTLVKLFEARVKPGESLRADQLSEETRRAIPGFRPNYYGSSSFTKLLDRMGDVFELARRGPNGQMASLEGPQGWPIVVLRRN